MAWDLNEALAYYKRLGAPREHSALVSFLREVQQEHAGRIPKNLLPELAECLDCKESYLQAVIRRIPNLRVGEGHVLEICGGANCPKRAPLAAFVEQTYGKNPKNFTVKEVPCMRLCGKGPNIKWDGQLYHQADEQLVKRLVEE